MAAKIFYAYDHMTETAVVVQKAYEWNLWILPKVEKFPKSYRFSVGQKSGGDIVGSVDVVGRRDVPGEERLWHWQRASGG